ncbi:MAG: Bax inhibitor-1/YccA family protein [Candidatus Omnitrophica bacterium]|nr:Bax inhibitor-1/YccA family protein [Candidatus Omnitrophota bacterium]
MRSGNPVLRNNTFTQAGAVPSGEVMTIQGTVNKTMILLLLLVFSASMVWKNPVPFMPFMWPSIIGGFICAMVTIFNKKWAAITAPLYAFIEGLFLGCFSALMERQYPGIVIQAVGLTFGTLFCLLMAYTSRLIKPTENFKLGIVSATGGIALFYFISIIVGFFGIQMPLIHSSGPFGIAFSFFVVTIAALNLVLDFDFIEKGAESGAPRYMEWYGAFGLVVTLIWLYIEILRLLSKLRSRN